MKIPILRFTLFVMIIYVTGGALNPAVAASQLSGGNGTHFCGVTDSQSNKRLSDQFPSRRYARSFAANLNVGEPRTVRMIYFLPNDRSYNADIVQQMKDDMLYTRDFYAEQMEVYGYGKLTFRIETDAQGEPIVHRMDGDRPDSYYFDNTRPMFDEIEREFDLYANIYFILIDNGRSVLDRGRVGGVGGRRGKEGGFVLLPTLFSWDLVAHELGHAFGLLHDFRDAAYIMSYGPFSDQIAACTAESLSVHPYFNPNTSTEEGPPPTIELISSSHHQGGSESVPVRLKVSSSEGLHQVLLRGRGGLVACRGYAGEKDARVEFDYKGVFTDEGFTSLSDLVTHPIYVEAVDTDGNSGYNNFTLTIEPAIDDRLDADVEVSIPDANLRAKIAEVLNVSPSTSIVRGQLAQLTGLVATETNISNLTGLEFATNLKLLEVWSNRISDISPLAGLTKLERLIIEGNRISDISAVAGLTKLTRLILMDNNISDISAVAGLTNLELLHIRGNPISDISAMAGLTKLRWVWGGDNNISDISALAGLTKLVNLWLSDNNISDISPLVANTGLRRGNTVRVRRNPLSYQSIHTHIPVLESRGVTVEFDDRTPTAPLKILGDNQQGVPGAALEQPFVVAVRDQNGVAFAEVPVVFAVTEGGGTLSTTSTITDVNGRAQSTLTLGSEPGANTVEVSVAGISQTVIFSAEATPPLPIPTTLEYVSGDNQSGLTGEPLSQPFTIEVRDENGDPLEGISVTFVVSTGGGSLSDTSVDTGADGLAQSTLTLGSDPGTNMVEASVEGIAEMVTFTALAEIEFNLSMPAGINLIHVPLKVSTVDGVAQTIISIPDLYDALGGASKVNFLITYGSQTQEWHSYFGTSDTGTPADRALTDDMGIIAGMIAPASIRLTGSPLGTDGNGAITLNQGLNLVGLPLRDSRINRASDLFGLEGIGGNVPVIILTDNGEFKAVGRAKDPGDIPIIGGQAFIMTAQQGAMVTISGDGWYNTSAMAAAPPIALTGIEVKDTTPVLALRGSIVDEEMGTNRTGFHVIVKNLSTGRAVAAVTKDENYSRSDKRKSGRVGYQVTVVDVETGRASTIGDNLEISVRSPDPSIGVEPLRYTVTAEDVKQSLIQLPALVTYEIPAETQLLANYPNPFNPETWIPYRLAEDAFVTLTIYDLSGQVVRALEVGHQIAAVYEDRSKAVYWDGRNQVREQVASGVYFYTLTAGDYSATRKMVILK